MIELVNDSLVASFPGVHPDARIEINFQRTLRIPDDGQSYPLPPGLGRFPVRHVDDLAERVPPAWLERGGVVLPMYQSEAVWLAFNPHHSAQRRGAYPFAIKVAAGKINAVTGDAWSDGLSASPQDYLVAPTQPWLDGFCVRKGSIRQFVAMALGLGYSVEEQLTSEAQFGGLQIVVYPMKAEVFERRFPKLERARLWDNDEFALCCSVGSEEMGLAPGGLMRQEIYEDPYGLADWDTAHRARCFAHIANSLAWQSITGERPPHRPFTARDYTRVRLPWFEFYDETARPLEGSDRLDSVRSVAELDAERRLSRPEDRSVSPRNIVDLRRGLSRNQVREGAF